MSTRRPSENVDQMHLPDTAGERRRETEDRPDLPLDERLERAAERFEDRVAEWEQQRFDADPHQQVVDIERYLGHIQDIVYDPIRRSVGPVAYAETRMQTTGPNDRKRKVQKLRKSAIPPERRQRLYGKAQGQGNNRVLDHHGAARWFERPGNHERLTGLLGSLGNQVSRAA